MEKSTAAILAMLAGIGGMSMIYFLCLVCGLPFPVCMIMLLVLLAALCRWVLGMREEALISGKRWLPLAILTAGVFLITNRTYYVTEIGGGWDAWGIWNYHARFLLDGARWTNVFRSVQYDHPDYPLGLPAAIACITRLAGGQHLAVIAFALSFFVTLVIPVIIFSTLYRRNLLVAAIMLLLFATDDYYLTRGVSQYADTLLAAFLLAGIVTIQDAADHPGQLLLAAFFAGCAAWIKNEGIILAGLFLLFYSPAFFSRQGIRSFALGAGLPLIVLSVFKLHYAPGNDLFYNSHNTLPQLVDRHRYALIARYFYENGKAYFLPTAGIIVAYAIAIIYQRRRPDRSMVLLWSCLGVYLLIYVLTPYDPEWHLQTSQDRLMHQLMPAMMYVAAARLCTLRLPRRLQQAL